MWPLPNPLSLFGDAVGGAVGWAWDKVIEGIYTWFAAGLLMLMEWVWGVLNSATTPRLTEDWFASGLVGPLAAISLSIIVALMLASAIQAGFAGRPELIIDTLKEGPKAIVATTLTVVVMDVLIRGADELSGVIWEAGRGDVQRSMDSMASTIGAAGGLAATFLGPLALLFGMIGLLVTAVVLFMRSTLLYLVAGFAPIVWASSVAPMMRGSGRRLVQLTVALVLAKPAITLTLVVGLKLVASSGTPGVDGQATDGAAALGTLVTGFACFAIAGLSPWVVFKLLPTVEHAGVTSGIVGGWGRTGMTAVSAGLMVKSLGASAAGSAATRAVPQMSGSAGGLSGGGAAPGMATAGGGGALSAASGSSGSTSSSPASGGLSGRSSGSHRPPVPAAGSAPDREDDPPPAARRDSASQHTDRAGERA